MCKKGDMEIGEMRGYRIISPYLFHLPNPLSYTLDKTSCVRRGMWR